MPGQKLSNLSYNSSKWFVRHSDEILWLTGDDACVAFHRPSAMTHFLNESSKALLTEVLAEPKDLQSIMIELGLDVSDDAGESAVNQIVGLLNRFEHLGLVDRL